MDKAVVDGLSQFECEKHQLHACDCLPVGEIGDSKLDRSNGATEAADLQTQPELKENQQPRRQQTADGHLA